MSVGEFSGKYRNVSFQGRLVEAFHIGFRQSMNVGERNA